MPVIARAWKQPGGVFRRRWPTHLSQRRALRHLYWSAPAVADPPPFTVLIGGVNYTDRVLQTSFHVTDALRQAPSTSFSLIWLPNETPTLPTYGAEILVSYQGIRMFAGTLDTISDPHKIRRGWIVDVGGTGWRGRCAKRIVRDKSYSNQTLHAIASDLRSSYLSIYGISMATMAGTGPTLGTAAALVYDQDTLDTVFDDLARAASAEGWTWTITPQKELLWTQANTTPAPFAFSDAAGDVMTLGWAKRNKSLVNRVIIGWTLSGVEQTEKEAETGAYATDPQEYFEHIGEATSSEAQAYADTKLTELAINARVIHATTRRFGLQVGQTVTVSTSAGGRNVNGTFVITSVSASVPMAMDTSGTTWLLYEVDAIEEVGLRHDRWEWWKRRLVTAA